MCVVCVVLLCCCVLCVVCVLCCVVLCVCCVLCCVVLIAGLLGNHRGLFNDVLGRETSSQSVPVSSVSVPGSAHLLTLQ